MKLKEVLNRLIVLVILFIVIYFGYILLVWVFHIFKNTQNEVIVAFIGAVGTLLTAISVAVITQKQSKQRDIDEIHRPKKVEIYRGFLEILTKVMCDNNSNVTSEKLKEGELIDFLVKFRTEILLWGSPKIISEYLNLYKISNMTDKERFQVMNDFIRYIREDIGLSNKKLTNYELIKTYLNDPDELDKLIK